MSPPTKELMKLTLEQKIAHDGHPVLCWMMDNIFIRTVPAENIKADKEKSTEKIDGAVACKFRYNCVLFSLKTACLFSLQTA